MPRGEVNLGGADHVAPLIELTLDAPPNGRQRSCPAKASAWLLLRRKMVMGASVALLLLVAAATALLFAARHSAGKSAPASKPRASLPRGLSAMYLDVYNQTNCFDVCFGSFTEQANSASPAGRALLSATVKMSAAGYPGGGIQGGIMAASPDAIFSSPIDNSTGVVAMAPRDGSPVRLVALHRGKRWPASAMSHDLYIAHLEWDSSGVGQLYALVIPTSAGPLDSSWGGYCAIDVNTGAADWVGAFPMHEVAIFVTPVSGFDPASGTIYTAAMTQLGIERVYSFTRRANGSFAASTSWDVAGFGLNASLAGLAINPGKLPVAVINPIDEQSVPAGAPTGGPVVLQLLPGSQVRTLYDFGPDLIVLSAYLGTTTGGDNSVAILLGDESPQKTPWHGARATLAIVPLDLGSKPVLRLDIVPLFAPESFAGLVYLP